MTNGAVIVTEKAPAPIGPHSQADNGDEIAGFEQSLGIRAKRPPIVKNG